MSIKEPTHLERLAWKMEDLIMTRLVPRDRPGPAFKWLFKTPLFFYRIGLPIFGSFVLILTTTGRKSARLRRTPLEYRREPGSGDLIIMAGWGGRTDWKRNLQADPHVHVQVGRRAFDALAEALPEAEVADWLAQTLRVNPASARTWSRWAGEPVSLEAPESILRAARHFPSFRLKPEEGQ
jgi:deazaflavin-dependent oxidoreductase (nitroreductase family)